MASVNQAKFVLFIFCIFVVMQSSACESRRQARLENQDSTRTVASQNLP